MMAGLTSMMGDMSAAAGLYNTEEDEGEELVAAGPGLDALLGLERSVSNAMVVYKMQRGSVAKRSTQRTHGQTVHAAALAAGCELSLILRDRFTRRASSGDE